MRHRRQVARVSHVQANRWLFLLAHDGVIEQMNKGDPGKRQAAEYNGSEGDREYERSRVFKRAALDAYPVYEQSRPVLARVAQPPTASIGPRHECPAPSLGRRTNPALPLSALVNVKHSIIISHRDRVGPLKGQSELAVFSSGLLLPRKSW